MESIYEEYLRWFKDNAVEEATAVGAERLLDSCICVDEVGNHIQAYYLQYIKPSESRSGELEVFIIEEYSEAVFEAGDIVSINSIKHRRKNYTL